LFIDLNAKGIETSGKIKREIKMFYEHQEKCSANIRTIMKEK
jgi:hypothetical protein